ncbi:MAG: GNAT family N-acetyltransferase [Flavobacterium sp.]|nr:GNAT family N-acetyltransferase [Flavobacterium sp.]MBP6074101.1 GNAT family N-acetyltransferase [Flavobacterium sp.]
MKSYHVRTYQSADYASWNEFVAQSKNATFLFHRDFMEYHSDRFDDFSVLILDKKQKIKAVLPANKVGSTLYSHQGLTYGGLVLQQKTKLQEVIAMMQIMLQFLKDQHIDRLQLKQLPSIYCDFPSDEMEQLCFLLKAQLVKREALAVVDFSHKMEVSRVRKRGIERGQKLALNIKEVSDFEEFWTKMLVPNLQERYAAKPVHSLAEITHLKAMFPENIRQFNVYFENEIIGGVTLFVTKNVLHPQYISGNKKFNTKYGGLDFLYHHVMTTVATSQHYFNFGSSSENNGLQLNTSLHYWKESFGGRTVVQNYYEIATQNHDLLDTVLL